VIGREPELAQLEALLASPGAVVISGAPGIGKTTLWEAAVDRARGLRILSARVSGAESGLAFAALTELLEHVGTDALDTLPAPQRRGLEVALLGAEPGGTPAEPRAIVLGFLNALRALSAREPVLVAIDDVQWLDRSSADALAFAARRLRTEDVRFLVTRRTGEESALDEVLADAPRVDVTPLSLGAIRRVLFDQLGLRVTRRVLRQIADDAAGNPLFALELGRTLEASGPPPIGEHIAAPEALEDLVGARVAGLPNGPRRVLLAVALSGDMRVPQLAAIADQHDIDDARDAGLLTIERARVRPSHPLLGAAARQSAAPAELRDLHRALAGAVDREHRAFHLALTAPEPDPELAATVAEAAARAAARTHAEEAALLGRHALRLTPDGAPERTDRLLALARYLTVAGEDERAADLLGEEIDALPDAARARAYLLLADSGVVETVADYEHYLDLAYEVSAEHPGLRAEAIGVRTQATTLGRVERIAEAEMAAMDALPAARHAGAALEREVLGALGWARAMRGLPIDDLLARYRAASDEPAYIYRSVERPAAMQLAWRGEIAAAQAVLADMLARADERGEAYAYVAVRLNLVEVDLRAGDLDRAQRLLEEWAESGGGELVIGAIYERCRALLAATRGRASEAEDWAGRALAGAEASGMVWDRLETLRALGIAALVAGDHDRAVEHLTAVWDHTERTGVGEPGVFPVAADLVEALAETGGDDRGIARRLAESRDHPWASATAERCAAVVPLVDAYDDGAAAALERAAVAYDEQRLRVDAARTRLALGRAQRRFRKWGAARASLERAAEEFDGLGAPGWAEVARTELARVGARRPTASGDLTPAERRVAELAASGLANKAIAAELVVTVHTVEVHLSKAYKKLGVRSRGQLAGRLGDPKD
jgi:DNA-binding CsgD family transcriptional regulator